MQARDGHGLCPQFLAGMAFNNASLGVRSTAMAHQLGGFYDLAYGVCNAGVAAACRSLQRRGFGGPPARCSRCHGRRCVVTSPPSRAPRRRWAQSGSFRPISCIPAGLAELGMKDANIPTLAKNAHGRRLRLHQPASGQSGRDRSDLPRGRLNSAPRSGNVFFGVPGS